MIVKNKIDIIKKKTTILAFTNNDSYADEIKQEVEKELKSIFFFSKFDIPNFFDKINEINPDIIIFEILTLPQDFLDFVNYLKKNFSNIPVIIIDGGENNDGINRFESSLLFNYLTKKDINSLGLIIKYVLRENNIRLKYFKTKKIIRRQKALLKKYHNIYNNDQNTHHYPTIAGAVFDQYLFKVLIDGMPDAIYFKDLESKFIKVNNGFIKKVNAASESDILGKTDFDIFDFEHARDARKDELYIIKTGKFIESKEEKEILASGKISWVSTTKLPLRNTNGDIIGTLGMSRDITESKKIQVLLKHSEERLRYLISSTSAVLYNMRIYGTQFNPVWVGNNINLFGYVQKEVLNPEWWIKVVHPDDLQYVNSVKKALFTSEKQLLEYRILHKEGYYIWIRDEMILLKDSFGTPIEIFGSLQDISERMKIEEALIARETQLSNALRIAHLGHWEYDVINDLFTFNDQFYSLLRTSVKVEDGYTMSSAKYADRFVYPEDIPLVSKEIKEAIESKDSKYNKKLEHRIVYPDGEIGYISVMLFIIKNADGKTIKTYGVNQDITDIKKAEENLRANEYFLRKSQSVAHIGSYKYDIKSGNWTSSETLDKILGIDKNYIKNFKGWFKVIHPEHLKYVINFIKNDVVSKRMRFVKEFVIIKQDCKQETWIQAIGDLEIDQNGNPIALIGIIQDITDRVLRDKEKLELEKQLKERNKELEIMLSDLKRLQGSLIQTEKMASLGLLSAGIAHEINNPLSYVASNINRIKEYFQDTVELLKKWQNMKLKISSYSSELNEIEKFTDQIDLEFILDDFDKMIWGVKDGTERIRKIVEGIRGFSYLSNNPHMDADINKAIDDTITIVWNEIKYKASIEKEYSELPSVKCNIQEIKQIVVNLLVNASHAITDKGTIKIITSRDNKNVYIKIQDTGCGISEENLKRIFDPFYTTKPIGKGTGLGLWICSSIIEKHCGSIKVESEVGKGSKFIVILPLE